MKRTWYVLTALLAVAASLIPDATLLAQSGTIRGTVTDSATTFPIEGALVTVVGTSLQTQTNPSGHYRISGVSSGDVQVRVQLIGYAPTEQAVTVPDGGETTVDFTLAAGVAQLEEIVSVGYGSSVRGELSTAVSSVASDQIANQPIASIDGALQGKAPGVAVIQNAGNPGNGMSVRVRGMASISANSDPLYVVDGVPIVAGDISQLGLGGQTPAAISGLSPDDIDRVDILKDAAATAIYGSRGSNGVVVITTKRGFEGKTNVTFNSYIGSQSASKRVDLLTGPEYQEFFRESAVNDEVDPDDAGIPGTGSNINEDWQSAVLRTAPVSSAELAVSGGDERLRYRLAGTWFDQDGIVIPSGYRRVGGRLNLDFNPNSRLSLSTSLALSGEHIERLEGDGSLEGIVTNAFGESPSTPVRLDNGEFAGPDDADLVYPNPVALAEFNPVRARSENVIGNVEARFKIVPELQYTGRVGLNLVDLKEDQFLSRNVNGSEGAGLGGSAKNGYSASNRYVIDNFLTFVPRLGTRSELDATGGASVELTRTELNFIRGDGFSNDDLTQVSNAAVISEGDGTNSRNNLVSFFARANYTLDRKFIFGGSVRTDGSSRFGPNNRWGFFPSASAAWVLSEDFLKGSFFDYLKVRASYGLTGNQAISDFPFQGLITDANYGDTPGSAPSNLANPDLKWETTKQFDIGTDMAVAKGRISLTADYYEKRTDDLLLERPISGTSGFATVFDNVGGVLNKGWELGLTTVNIDSRKTDGFRWTTTLNLGRNINRVTSLFNNQPFNEGIRDINRVAVGEQLGAFYTLHFTGVDPQTGDAIFEDRNHDGAITADDQTIVGSPWPDWTGGFTSTMNFKGFDLTGFLVISQGAEIFNAMRIFADNGGCTFDNQFTNVLQRWQKPGDITNVPRASYNCDSGADIISDRYVEDGSYWRLQDLTMGYRLPEKVAGGLGFASARFYVSVRNLFTETDYTGYSPDVNSNGANNVDSGSLATSSEIGLGTDFYAYPQPRTWTFGIQAGW